MDIRPKNRVCQFFSWNKIEKKRRQFEFRFLTLGLSNGVVLSSYPILILWVVNSLWAGSLWGRGCRGRRASSFPSEAARASRSLSRRCWRRPEDPTARGWPRTRPHRSAWWYMYLQGIFHESYIYIYIYMLSDPKSKTNAHFNQTLEKFMSYKSKSEIF